MSKRVINCIRKFHSDGLISSDEANIADLIKHFYRTGLNNSVCPNFSIFLGSLSKMKIILPKDPAKPEIMKFRPGKLDIILQHQDMYIEKTSNTVIIGQEISFKDRSPPANTCAHCNKTFGSKSALWSHQRAKKHIQMQHLLSPKYATNAHFIAECKPGAGNSSETIMTPLTKFEFELTLKNISTVELILNGITVMNPLIQNKLFIPLISGVPLAPSAQHTITISAVNLAERSYSAPLAIGFTNMATSEADGIIKDISLEIMQQEFQSLLPTSPFERAKRIATNMDETIVPGEKPAFSGEFQSVIRLQPYTLTSTYIQVFNSGLNDAINDTAAEQLRLKIKKLLDVANPSNCLTTANYGEMLNLFLYLEEHQMNTDILTYNCQRTLTHKRGNLYELQVPELSENRPSLIIGDSVYVKEPGAVFKYEGNVHEKHLDSVILGFNRKFASIFIAGKQFDISFGFNRSTLKVEHQAAKLVANYSNYFFPKAVLATVPTMPLKLFNRDLQTNEEQQTAVRNIVAGTSGTVPYLIFGPPGTGKTITMVESILQVHKTYPERRILICTPSNSAANLIASRLLEKGGFSSTELLRYISMSCSLGEIETNLKKYCNIKDQIVTHPTLQTLLKYSVVITTLVTAGRIYNIGVQKDHFQYVFIDESGHATESETLIPITAALISSGKIKGQIVLAGDPKQLGPIIHSSIAKMYGYGTSTLERLMNTNAMYQKHDGSYDNRVLTKLLKNYRSHPEIIRFPNEAFYEGELQSVGNPLTHLAIGDSILPNKNYPIIFHNVLGVDKREGKSPSFFNIQEIGVVKDYVTQLIGRTMKGRKIQAKDIAIITPYHKQVQKLRAALKMQNPNMENSSFIGTVEKFQGSERLIVIISTVRSKPEYVEHDLKYYLGFLRNPKRFNVAMTRAKALLIVVGNPELLKYDEYWRTFIQRCQDNKAVKGPTFNLDINEDAASLIDGFERITLRDVSEPIVNPIENHRFRGNE